MIFSEVLGNRLIHLSHHHLDGCERASLFPAATISKAEAKLLVNATDHWSLLVCDPSLATAIEEDNYEEVIASDHNSQTIELSSETSEDYSETSEEGEDEALPVDYLTSDENGTGEASEDEVSLDEEHTVDDDGNHEASENGSSWIEDRMIHENGIGAEHGNDRNTIYSDAKIDWEDQQEIR